MVEVLVLSWFAEVDGNCGLFERALPAGEVAQVAEVPGSCEIAAVAPGPDGLLVLQGTWQLASVWQVRGDEVTQLGGDLSVARHVAWSAEGAPLVLTAAFDTPGDPFVVTTWQLADGEWVEAETAEEQRRTVRAVEGGPLWQARQPGASVDVWSLERSMGMVFDDAESLRPRGFEEDVLGWGRIPGKKGELVLRYTMLGVPMPVGPVWWSRGKSWKLLDDQRFMETPASLQGAGRWRVLSYEGASPMVIDMDKGKVVWRAPEDAWLVGAMLR